MASASDHRAKSAYNKSAAKQMLTLGAAAPCDWAITMCFYSALHLVQAQLIAALGSSTPTSHADRTRQMQAMTAFRPALGDYKALKSLSEQARYDCVAFNPNDVHDALKLVFNIEQALP